MICFWVVLACLLACVYASVVWFACFWSVDQASNQSVTRSFNTFLTFVLSVLYSNFVTFEIVFVGWLIWFDLIWFALIFFALLCKVCKAFVKASVKFQWWLDTHQPTTTPTNTKWKTNFVRYIDSRYFCWIRKLTYYLDSFLQVKSEVLSTWNKGRKHMNPSIDQSTNQSVSQWRNNTRFFYTLTIFVHFGCNTQSLF